MMDHWTRYEIDPATGCWNWTGPKDQRGYGTVRLDGETRAHRAYYRRHVGAIPDGLTLDHLCGNPGCVNPAHLEPATNKENILRGSSPSAQAARQTHCVNGHELTGDNLVPSKAGHRICRACNNERRRQARREGKAYASTTVRRQNMTPEQRDAERARDRERKRLGPAENAGARADAEASAQLADALRILNRFEYLAFGATLKKDEHHDPHRVCPVCTWPEGGHNGPGRYKGNDENSHEAGCSMYAVLHGLDAPRLAGDPLPQTHPLATADKDQSENRGGGSEGAP